MRVPLPALLLPLLAVLTGCGETQVRPVVVATAPAHGTVAPGAVREVKVDFDVPVRILNPGNIEVYGEEGLVPVLVYQLAAEPRSIRAYPYYPGTFRPGGLYAVILLEGLVATDEEHYLEDEFAFTFTVGPAPEVLLGTSTGDRVVVADPETLVALTSTPTPGARDPVGLLGTELGGTKRAWVQLASGGGTGASLARFSPGDAAMTVVPLTHVGDLTGARPTLVLDQDARALFVAYRDEGLGRVRVARVDVATSTETHSLVLSPAASPVTAPLGLTIDGAFGGLVITCRGPGGDRVCQMDRTAFVEIDRGPDPGVDGLPLPSGGGPVISFLGYPYLAPITQPNAHLTTVNLDIAATYDIATPTTPGVPNALALGRDTGWTLEGLLGYAGGNGLVYYLTAIPTSPVTLAVSDDVGGGPTGSTEVRAIGAAPSTFRFVALLGTDVAAFLTWNASAVSQEDRDPVAPGVQAVPLPPAAAGADAIGWFTGAVP